MIDKQSTNVVNITEVASPQAKRVDLFDKCSGMVEQVDQAMEAGIYPYFHEISTRQHSEVTIGGKRTIMLGSNNYLGLTSDDRVIAAAKSALDEFGSGCSGSRFLNGTLTLHNRLERDLAEFLGKEAAMTFSTGFQSNLGIISTLVGRHDIVFFDKLNHASLLDAVRLSYGKLQRYAHNDMDELEQLVKDAPESAGKLIVVDGVFSMEGDLADLPNIVRIARKYGCRVMVDDSHGIGVLGEHGRGTAEHFGLENEIDLLMGTFSKSFASLGGFLAADKNVVQYTKHTSRPFIFSASMPPANVAAVLEALRILKAEPEMLIRLRDNAKFMRAGLRKLNIPAGDSQSPVIPISTYSTERTFQITAALLENGVYVNPVISPAVPAGDELIRTSYTATHTQDQLEYALDKFDIVFNKLFKQ